MTCPADVLFFIVLRELYLILRHKYKLSESLSSKK